MGVVKRKICSAAQKSLCYSKTMPLPKKAYDELFELFCSIKTKKEAQDLLKDILTPQELDSVAERWQEIQLLAAGRPQREIAKKLGISISKITRGSRMLQYGTGGFAHFLKKLKKPIKQVLAKKTKRRS